MAAAMTMAMVLATATALGIMVDTLFLDLTDMGLMVDMEGISMEALTHFIE